MSDTITRPDDVPGRDDWFAVLFEDRCPYPYGRYPHVEVDEHWVRCEHPDGGADLVPRELVIWIEAPSQQQV